MMMTTTNQEKDVLHLTHLTLSCCWSSLSSSLEKESKRKHFCNNTCGKESRVSCNSTCYLPTFPKWFDSGQARSDDDRYALHSLCSFPDPLSPKGNLKKVLHRILAGRCLVVMMGEDRFQTGGKCNNRFDRPTMQVASEENSAWIKPSRSPKRSTILRLLV